MTVDGAEGYMAPYPYIVRDERRMSHTQKFFWLIAACLSPLTSFAASHTPSSTVSEPAPSNPPRQVFAHYMGNFPAGTAATAYHRGRAHLLRHDAGDRAASLGGRIRNWPLLPEGAKLSRQESAKLEIERAVRIGVDGFAVDAWAGRDDAKNTLSALFAAAEEIDAPFYLTICLDPNCHKPVEPDGLLSAYEQSLRWLMENHGDSPKLARRDGEPLIFGYQSRGLGRDKRAKDALKDPAEWDAVAGLYAELERRLDQAFYFHFGMGAFFYGVDLNELEGARPPHQPGPWMVKASGRMAEYFPAVGSFIDRDIYADLPAMAQAVQAAGAEWSQPMWHQYQNMASSLMVQPGTDMLRDRWRLARESGSTLIQYVTWNDYGEATNLAPCYRNRYAVYDLTGYMIRWWKEGAPPKVDRDRVYVFYRSYPKEAETFPFRSQRFQEGVLEVLTLLSEPGEIRLPGRDAVYQAPAGLHVAQFPLAAGDVTAELWRRDARVVRVAAPDPISDAPFREDNAMVAFSSEFERHWREDFGDAQPFYASMYGDADGDGLPNWFEMYWFGKFQDWSTATLAGPSADADGDGLTNLQEYRAQTDPTTAQPVYQAGDVWDMSTVHARRASFNPDADFHQTPVWHYLYRMSAPPVPLDGDYKPCPHSPAKTPYTGPMSHHAPYAAKGYKHVHGWFDRVKTDDGDWRLRARPRREMNLVLGWESPVSGVVSLEIALAAKGDTPGPPAWVTLQRGDPLQELARQKLIPGDAKQMELKDIDVKRGQMIYVVLASPGQNVRFEFEKLAIQLTRLAD